LNTKPESEISDAKSEGNAGSSVTASPKKVSGEQPEIPKNEGSKEPVPVTDQKAEAKLRREAGSALKEAKKLFKRAQKKLSADRQKEVQDAISDLEESLKDSVYSCKPAFDKLQDVFNKRLKFAKKSGTQEVVESLLIALAVALFLRTFLIEPFKIPTRSMVPTLLEGDQLFVTKLSYGLRLPILNKYVAHFSDPERGDVIVFAFPREDAAKYLARTNSGCLQAESLSEDKDYIKRIIGVAGDTIEVLNQVVYVNGEPISQQPAYQRTVSDYRFLTDRLEESWNREKHGLHSYMTITHAIPDNHFGPIKVEPGHVFVMGDNRDNSADSRCWGQVPVDNIKGRAQILWWSQGHVGIRWERMFDWID
jgi:signal peptidase I